MNTLLSLSPATVNVIRGGAAVIVFDFLVVIIATVCDLVSAVRKSMRQGIRPRSRGFRRTVDKLMKAYNAAATIAVYEGCEDVNNDHFVKAFFELDNTPTELVIFFI